MTPFDIFAILICISIAISLIFVILQFAVECFIKKLRTRFPVWYDNLTHIIGPIIALFFIYCIFHVTFLIN